MISEDTKIDKKGQVPQVVFKKTAKELANEVRAEAKAKDAAVKAKEQAQSLADAYVEKPRLNPDSIGKTLLDRMPNRRRYFSSN